MPKVPVVQDNQLGNVVIYRDENDKVQIHALFQDETLVNSKTYCRAFFNN